MANDNTTNDLPKQDKKERISVQAGITTVTDNRITGDSIDEHRSLESANTFIAEKEIKQAFHNS
ncbi:hypothetical protein [Oceanobacillus saliphilus]|uniref:hypothetical protein n=1 Tax=Oceanobacillus saliphilus TaxID=2925834 RepID=UPI00201E2BE0|nr:hypothetical protein [Oceanobacillus saliphilus]